MPAHIYIAGSRQQAAGSRQQAAGSRQQAAAARGASALPLAPQEVTRRWPGLPLAQQQMMFQVALLAAAEGAWGQLAARLRAALDLAT
jgi:hypothetical protein